MNLKWVNHASYILESENIRLITDPWIEGRVFNESWSLLVPAELTFEDFKDITHIWFSHEHPDHFFPPNLTKIPQEYRNNITVLFQKTSDNKVAAFCTKIGFKSVVELNEYNPICIGDDIEVTIGKVTNDSDSWLFLEKNDIKILNLNDCVFQEEELERLSKYTGKVDILLTQFSFANWIGNKNDHNAMKASAERKLSDIERHISYFSPKYTIPFASYVWFCHEDNFHFNEFANKIDDVAEHIKKLNSIPVILYPGDTWLLKDKHDSSEAIQKYLDAANTLKQRKLTHFDSIPLETLEKEAIAFTEKALKRNNKRKLLSYHPMYIYLTDFKVVYSYSYRSGLKKAANKTQETSDISFHSQNLSYCFNFDWGFDTILIAGTFEKPEKGNFQNFMEYDWVANLNNRGKKMKGLLGRLLDRVMK